MRLRLIHKFVAVLVLVSVLPMALLGWRLISLGQLGVRTAILELHLTSADKIASEFNAYIRSADSSLRTVITAMERMDWENKQVLLATLLETRRELRQVSVISKDGAELVKIITPFGGKNEALKNYASNPGFKTALSAIPHMQSGKLKPIAVAANRRLPQIPNVPTMAEAGLADFEVSSWNGLLAPAKTPPEIVAKLNREFVRILATADVREKFAAQAAEPVGNTPEQFRAYIKYEIDKWAQVVKASGAKID